MKTKHAIGLLAALLVLGCLSVALVVHPPGLKAVFSVISFFGLMAGAVTITYEHPVSVQGTSVGPTVSQIYGKSEVGAVVNLLDADTTFTITHNFGNIGNGPTELSKGYPIPYCYYTSAGTGPVLFQMVPNATTCVFTKSTAAGSGGTLQVVLLRPSTNSR